MADKTILVVEDDAIISMRLQDTLETWGYDTDSAASGEEALELAAKLHPGLVLMDINLEGSVDGVETATLMRQMGIPSVFLTAYADDELIDRAKSAEPYGYLVKPVYERELRSTVEMALFKHSADLQIRASERRFRAVFQQAGVGVALVDSMSGQLIAANSKFWEVTDLKPEEALQNKTWADVTHPDDVELQNANLKRLWNGEIREFTMEKRYIQSDGEILWVNLTASAMWDSGESPTQHIVVIEDITARKRADEALSRRIGELEAVNRISSALRTAENLVQALPKLLDELLGSLKALSGAIYIYNSSHAGLDALETRGWLNNSCGITESGDALLALSLQEPGPLWISDFSTDTRITCGCRKIAPAGWSALVLPIRTMDEVLGMAIVSAPPAHKFLPEDLRLLETMVEIAGSAIHRMRLFEQTTRSLTRIESLHLIDNAIRSNLDRTSTLNVILENVIRQLKVDAADVLLVNGTPAKLIHMAALGFQTPVENQHYVVVGEGLAGTAAAGYIGCLGNETDFEQEPRWRSDLFQKENFKFSLSVPLVSKGNLIGVLEAFRRSDQGLDADQTAFMEILAGQAAVAVEGLLLVESLQRTNLELETAYHETIEGWSRAMDLRDRDTEGHTQRVTELTMALAVQMGMPEAQLADIRRGALLHDIGKIGVPDEILLKPGELSPEEWVKMRSHPQLAFELLAHIEFLRPAIDIPYAHHERWNGSGYPRGLVMEEIPMAARLFAVADVYDALVSDRPYRSAWTHQQAVEYIRAGAGTLFDPAVVDAFLQMIESKADRIRELAADPAS